MTVSSRLDPYRAISLSWSDLFGDTVFMFVDTCTHMCMHADVCDRHKLNAFVLLDDFLEKYLLGSTSDTIPDFCYNSFN